MDFELSPELCAPRIIITLVKDEGRAEWLWY